MFRRLLPLGVFFLPWCISHWAAADIRVPDAPERQTIDFVVKNNPRGETVIRIPRRLMVSAVDRGGAEGLAGSGFRNVLAGVAASLAIASIVLLRRKRTASNVAAVVVAIAAGGMTTAAVADISPPPRVAPAAKRPQIVVEFVDDADAVTLIRGRDFPR